MKSPHRLTARVQFPTSRFLKSQTVRKTARTIYSFASVCLGTSLLVAGLCGTASASELMNFSFSNTYGNVSGTVDGIITLPDACYTGCSQQAATDITLTSFPDVLSSTFGSTPVDISASLINQYQNSFTTDSSGNVTAAVVYFASPSLDDFILNSGACGLCDQLQSHLGYNLDNYPGAFSAITFSVVTPTPEPSTWATIALGLIGLAWRRRPISRER